MFSSGELYIILSPFLGKRVSVVPLGSVTVAVTQEWKTQPDVVWWIFNKLRFFLDDKTPVFELGLAFDEEEEDTYGYEFFVEHVRGVFLDCEDLTLEVHRSPSRRYVVTFSR